VLSRIDSLLDFFQGLRVASETETQLLALAVLTDLFVATRYWTRLAGTANHHATLKAERLPAAAALHGAVVGRLGQEIGGDAEAVQDFVRDFKCRTMSAHGQQIDTYEGPDIASMTPPHGLLHQDRAPRGDRRAIQERRGLPARHARRPEGPPGEAEFGRLRLADETWRRLLAEGLGTVCHG
jgi:hypothetical protein